MNNQRRCTDLAPPPPHWWARAPILALVVVMAVAFAVATALADTSTSDTANAPDVPTVIPTQPPALILLSDSSKGEIENDNEDDELRYANEDILAYDPISEKWSIFWDGSQYGLSSTNLEDFEYDPTEQKLYFTLDRPFKIPNPHGAPNPLKVDDSDIVVFDFATGSFAIFIAGSELGLSTGSEDIDGFAFAPPGPSSGHVLISTIGSASVVGASGSVKRKDEDILNCDVTTHLCEVYMDNSDIGLTKDGEDTDALWVDPAAPNNVYLGFKNSWKAQGTQNTLSGKKSDVLGCAPLGSLGTNTDCFLYTLFKGKPTGFEGRIDGLWVSFTPLDTQVNAQSDPNAVVSADIIDDELDQADYLETTSAGDSEIDIYDFFNIGQQIFLPEITR